MANIKIDNLYKVSQIVGGFGVFFTLIFFSIQFRNNTIATKSESASSAVSALTNWYSNLGNDKQSSDNLYQFMTEPDSLNEEEKFQAIMNLHSLMLVFQNAYYLELEGTLDDRLKKSLTSTIKGAKDQKGFKYYWNIRKSNFFDEFKKYVDEILLIEEQSVNIYNTIE